MTRPLWWNAEWDELCHARPLTGDGRLGRVGRPVADVDLLDGATADEILCLWPRLTHQQRERLRGVTLAGHVSGPLLACLVAEVRDDALRSVDLDERDELQTLVGLPIDVEALRLLAGWPRAVPGPLDGTVVGERFAAAFAGTVGRTLRQDILDAAVMSPHLSYDQAATLMSSDPRLVLARHDVPFDDVAEGYWESRDAGLMTRDATQDWRVAKHPGCPSDVLDQHLATVWYRTVLSAVDTEVSDAYVRGLLRHRNQSFRRLVIGRKPAQVARVMESLPVPTLQRLAEDCPPRYDGYVAAFMGHLAAPVRAAYVRAHPDHQEVAERALADPNRHVRTALVRYTSRADSLAGLAADPSPAIRREAASRLTRALSRHVP